MKLLVRHRRIIVILISAIGALLIGLCSFMVIKARMVYHNRSRMVRQVFESYSGYPNSELIARSFVTSTPGKSIGSDAIDLVGIFTSQDTMDEVASHYDQIFTDEGYQVEILSLPGGTLYEVDLNAQTHVHFALANFTDAYRLGITPEEFDSLRNTYVSVFVFSVSNMTRSYRMIGQEHVTFIADH